MFIHNVSTGIPVGRPQSYRHGFAPIPANGSIVRSSDFLYPFDEVGDDLADLCVGFLFRCDFVIRVDYGRMVPATEEFSDLRQGRIRELAAEVHRDLTRERDLARALF